jgi:hypothetical protein
MLGGPNSNLRLDSLSGLLGLKPTTLISRMKKFGLKRPEPAAPPQGR